MTQAEGKPSAISRIGNISVKRCGLFIALLMILIAAVSVSTNYVVQHEITAVGEAWSLFDSRDEEKLKTLVRLRSSLGYGGMIDNINRFIMGGRAADLARVRASLAKAESRLDEYRAFGISGSEDDALKDIRAMTGGFEQALAEIERLVADGADGRTIHKAIQIDDGKAVAALKVLENELDRAHVENSKQVRTQIDTAQSVVTIAQATTVVSFAIVVFFFIWRLIYRVIRPMAELSEAMTKLAEGKLEVEIPAVDRNDEIGAMAKAVMVFQETAISRLWAEEALRVGEGRLRLFVEHTPVAIAMFDADMCYMMCSRLWLDVYGLSDDEIIGRSHYELLPDTPEHRKDIFRRGLAGVGHVSEEDLVHRDDANATWTRWIVQPWRKSDGVVGGIIVISEDITKRKQAEEALRNSQRRFAAAQQIARVGHWEWDIHTNRIFLSREIAAMIGEGDQDIHTSFDNFLARVHPDDRPRYDNELDKFRETRGPFEIEYRINSSQGDVRVLHEKGEFIDGADDSSPLTFGMTQDITELTQAQEAVRERDVQNRLIMENIADGVITIDEAGVIEAFFGAAEKIFGYSAEEVLGKNISMLMPDPHHSAHDGYLAAYARGEGGAFVDGPSREVVARRKDGALIPIDFVIGKLIQGGRCKFIGTVRDMTEQKLIDQRLRDSKRIEAIGELAGGVAHDFNNILMVIHGFTQRAVANMDNPEQLKRSLDEVIKSADKGATLTHQLLMFGRRELLESRVVNVADQVDDFLPLLGTLVGETIRLNVEITDADACIETDPSELYQAIVNLAVNGRDAMPDGGALAIKVERVEFDALRASVTPNASPGSYVCLSVCDNGFGMDGDTLMRVFEPFFTTKEQGKGTGLGLALVYGFVKQSNGVIEVNSSPGEGTSFSLYFPAVDRKPAVEAVRRTIVGGSNNETILLAEDDDALRMLARETLEDHGYHVLVAGDGVEALEVEDDYEGTIHVLVTDVVMPGLSGFDVAEAMRMARPDMKVVFMSGYPTRGKIQSVEIPADAPFLQKPFQPEILADMVRQTLSAVDGSCAPSGLDDGVKRQGAGHGF